MNVNIKTNNIKYEIVFSTDIFNSIKGLVKNYKENKFLLVVDDYVYSIYKKLINDGIKKINSEILLQKHGERNKNINSVLKIINKLEEKQFTKKNYIISIGGGVTGDISGFTASLFKRGINLIQVPTTLLSMFDSSVGGKTGVDYNGIKNCIGAFYNPNYVIINKLFLKTLEKKEILGGFFEGYKHSILKGKKDYLEFSKYFKSFEHTIENKNFDKIISNNIKYKLSVVKSDPFETIGKRRVLNYGHTFGHAIETHSNFKLGHGICVGIGIIFANVLSYNLGFLNKKTYLEIEHYIKSKIKGNYKLKALKFEKLYKYMQNDKKNESNKIKFILLKDFGKVFEYDVEKKDIKIAFNLFIKSI